MDENEYFVKLEAIKLRDETLSELADLHNMYFDTSPYALGVEDPIEQFKVPTTILIEDMKGMLGRKPEDE